MATVKLASQAIVAQAQADIAIIVSSRLSGKLTNAEMKDLMKVAITRLHGTQVMLARGGPKKMREQDWSKVSSLVQSQHEYLEKFLSTPNLSVGKLATRALNYADAGRSTYENERIEVQKEDGDEEACRILGILDHCGDCIEAAAQGWVPIDEVVAISDTQCGVRCGCTIITRRRSTPSSERVDAAIESAKTKLTAYKAE